MIHGGDTISYRDYYDGDLVDYSSNINPLGMPEGLEEELIAGFSKLTSYPDIKYRNLKEAVAQYLKCHRENILVGNGAVEIIDNFIHNSEKVMIVTPSFAEYELRSKVHKKQVSRLEYGEDFKIDLRELEEKLEKNQLLILGNPNNPTGLRIEKEELLNIYKIVISKEASLLLDEAFFEFCPWDYDSIEIFKEYKYRNVGIIRAATKFFALPGIRLGYGCTSLEKVKEIEELQLPWSVNSLANTAGNYIFKQKEYIEKSKDYIARQRNLMLAELEKIENIKAYNSHTDYILIKSLKYDEDYLFEFFAKRGIIIRKASSFVGLDKFHIRIAIKDEENNLRVLNIFKDLI